MWMKQLEKDRYISKNKKVKIRLTKRKGHVHVKFMGIYKKSGLTSICYEGLTKIEKLILINHLYMMVVNTGYISSLELDSLNYASIFGSCFSLGAK